jgi:hypothetical protein
VPDLAQCEAKAAEEKSRKGVMLSKIGNKSWDRVYDKTVENKFAETGWPVYETYLPHSAEDFRYIRVPEKTSAGSLVGITKRIDPLSPKHAGLFLEFA